MLAQPMSVSHLRGCPLLGDGRHLVIRRRHGGLGLVINDGRNGQHAVAQMRAGVAPYDLFLDADELDVALGVRLDVA